MSGRVLVAGVGNIFLADDGFGVEVVRRLGDASLPDGVQVRDFGIRGVHLAYLLLDGFDLLILVDALARGRPPGTVTLFEPDPPGPEGPAALDAHEMDPASVLAMVRHLGGNVGRTLVVGCEPAELVERIGLSPVVDRAVDEAVRMVRRLVANQPGGEERTTC